MTPGAGGNCFEAALDTALTLVRHGARAVHVCHGRPIGKGPLNNGKRYWHAWVEYLRPGWGWVVVDATTSPAAPNRVPILARRTDYYEVGQIVAADVLRYGARVAGQQAIASGHTGPWVPQDQLDAAL